MKIDIPPKKFLSYEVFPLKVVDYEKRDILLTNSFTKKLVMKIKLYSVNDALRRSINRLRAALEHHKLICGPHKPIHPKMPLEGEVLEFTAWQNTQRHLIVIYADFEALLLKANERKGKNTTIIQKHCPMSYGFLVNKAPKDVPTELLREFNIPTEPVIYRGSESRQDVAKHFIENITDMNEKIEKLLETNIILNISDKDNAKHNSCFKCNLCKCAVNNHTHVRDHHHLTSKFRQTLCNRCNLSIKQPKYVPVFLHNLSNYDAHFQITELENNSKRINVIPNSEENIKFVDKIQFMSTRLSTLAVNLVTPNLEKFRETGKHFSNNEMPLVTRKSVSPYDYTDDWSKLELTSLPPIEDFYSTLIEEHIKDSVYLFATEVWNHFNCQTLGEYSYLYLKIDELLLADVLENFRDLCLNTYYLDPAYYFTAPAFSFDAMLKYTEIKLELLSDYEMLLMFEDDSHKPACGMRNLIMKKYQILTHQTHNDLPFLPQNSIPPGSIVRKLMATFKTKKNHIFHYRNLQQALNNGLIVEKVHRIVQFKQSPWLEPYIILNTEMRKNAKNEFEKDFLKLLNNTVFGMLLKILIMTIFINFVWLSFKKNDGKRSQAFKYKASFSVLEISKTLMYDYHYNVMQKHYGDNIELMYTDTAMATPRYPVMTPMTERKNIPGLFSDETDGEICALRVKSYAYIFQGREKIKAKGIR
ncbi:hypothetical protein AGLY_017683, partial [Aphis glycines]